MNTECPLRNWIGKMIDTIPDELWPEPGNENALTDFIRVNLSVWLENIDDLETTPKKI